MHIYDFIIIGSGLTGLSIAKKISSETDNILVLESQDSIGGANKAVSIGGHRIENGLRFLPAAESTNKCVSFLESILNSSVVGEEALNLIQTYEASGFKEFVGFGEKSPEFYQQLSYFLSAGERTLLSGPSEWIQMLENSLSKYIFKKSVVTRFGFEGLDSEKPNLTHVVVNGSKVFHAKNFIFTGVPKDLITLMPDDVFNARQKAKLKKSQAWQAVCLDFFHTNTVEAQNLFLLNGTTDDEFGPCIGRFTKKFENGQVSQWLSFIDFETAEDTENIALIMKKMKRQIKRAFPEIVESVKNERIFVTPVISGADLKLSANGSFPKIENLWIASSQISNYPNLIGSLMQAQLILSSMGFGLSYNPSETSFMPERTANAD